MKRSTLLILLAAVIAGAAVYFLEIKPGKPRDETPDETKPAFKFQREDITALSVTRAGQTISLENKDGKWLITQPINAVADDSALNSLIGDVVSARIEREFSASADELKSYGLTEPAVKLEIKLKNGEMHRVELGAKDVIGSSAYAKVDGGQNVAMVPSSLLTNTDKSLNDLRDRSVFGATQYELASLRINNENGSFELGKKDADWVIQAPVAADADSTAVSGLLSELASAKGEEFLPGDDLAKYALDKPKITVSAKLTTGTDRVLLVSRKDDLYYAKVSDRADVYKIASSVFDQLNTKLDSLRSKDILKLNRDELTKVWIRNPNTTISAEKKDEKWIVDEPADKKGKDAFTFKLFDPLETKATEVMDKPSAAAAAKLAKPAVEVRLTYKDGKTTVVKVSSADGDNVYVRVEGKSGVYKVGKSVLDSLSFKLEEAVSPS